MQRIDIIREKLIKALSPSFLDVIDESHHHIGHPGAQTGGGHFAVSIASPAFVSKTMLQSHKLIYAALGDMMQKDIHALRINLIK
jgi:BolA protein